MMYFLYIYRNAGERGHFSQDGVTTTNRSGSIIRCSSNHLTSFAILVDVSGQSVSTMSHDNLHLSQCDSIDSVIIVQVS